MFIWGLITGIFWALVVAIILWVLCAFSCRFLNPEFRMSALLHLLCFAITIPTVVLLTMIFACNKVNRMVNQVEISIYKLLIADEEFVEKLSRQFNQTQPANDLEKATVLLTENFYDKLSSEYPLVGKFTDVNQILKKENFSEGIFSASINANTALEKAKKAIQFFTGSIMNDIRLKVNSIRFKSLITIILLQTIAFGTVFCKAFKYRAPARSRYYKQRKENYKKHKKQY